MKSRACPNTFSGCLGIVLFLLLMSSGLNANEIGIDPSPVAMVCNPGPRYSLINSVDYHPSQNLFCVTCTQSNRLLLYSINAEGKPELVQSLTNPLADLSQPQHAVFSPDGEKMVVANWKNQTFTVYQREDRCWFRQQPVAVIPSPSVLAAHKPHGIAFSPCGNYLAVANGSATYHGRGIALFQVVKQGLDFKLVHLLQEIPGIPKGITFSPDGTCLLVTFSDTNSLVIFDLSEDKKAILPTPRQVLQGEESQIFRPEDVKVSPNGNYCAISNSEQHIVTFYSFDSTTNRILQSSPCDILQNPEANFYFPHGLAFSPNGKFFLVTEFGQVSILEDGSIFWDKSISPDQSKFNLYLFTRY